MFKLKALAFAMVAFSISTNLNGQTVSDLKITGVYSGNETASIIYKAESKTNPVIKYVRAQVVGGPQTGFFVQHGDNIRFISESKKSGIPHNLAKIRFTFLQEDKRTPIVGDAFRVIINDIDGPNNEMLQTSCANNVQFVGTSFTTNLDVTNLESNLSARGTVSENEGATSRVMFVYDNVSFIEFESFGNYGYFKDFDFNQDYQMASPKMVNCSNPEVENEEFAFVRNMLVVQTNPIYFENDKSHITEEAEIELLKVVGVLKKYPELKIKLGSHTDSRADKDYNNLLSERRAQSSLAYIVNKGINIERIEAEGFGESMLVNNCTDNVDCSEMQHQLNRRTEFVIVNPEVVINEISAVKDLMSFNK